MLSNSLSVGRDANESDFRPLTVLQLTHSGRLTKSDGRPAPVIAHRHPHLDREYRLSPDYPLVSDGELEALQEAYVRAVRLAWQAGFGAVDVKSCHGYLLAELLTAHTRPGRYGGGFEGRTRFLLETVARIGDAVPGLLLASRINGHDGEDYLHSWRMSESEPGQVDLAEPIRLARALYAAGVRLLSVTLGAGPGRPRTRLEVLADHLATTRET